MKFAENETIVLTVPKYQQCFIYFLLQNGEVVYVGQTKHGLIRPLTHAKDKDFDEIKIIYEDENNLDLTEDKYIQKYKPIYNKQNNYAVRYSLLRVRDNIKRHFGLQRYTIPRLKKVIAKLNIKVDIDCYNGKEIIYFDDYNKIMEYLKRGGL